MFGVGFLSLFKSDAVVRPDAAGSEGRAFSKDNAITGWGWGLLYAVFLLFFVSPIFFSCSANTLDLHMEHHGESVQ